MAASDDVACAICLEACPKGKPLLCLPCGHSFHSACALEALAHSSECPCCRAPLRSDPGEQFNSFTLLVPQRIIMRFCEFVDSGMCERCQIAILEKQQFGRVTLADGTTRILVNGIVTDKEIAPRRWADAAGVDAAQPALS